MISSQAKAFAKDNGLRGCAGLRRRPRQRARRRRRRRRHRRVRLLARDVVRERWDAGRARSRSMAAARGLRRPPATTWGRRALRRPRRRRPSRRAALVGGRRPDVAGLPLFAGWRAVDLPADDPRRGSTSCCTCCASTAAARTSSRSSRAGSRRCRRCSPARAAPTNASFFGWEEPFEDVSGHVLARSQAEVLTDRLVLAGVRRPRPRRARRAPRAAASSRRRPRSGRPPPERSRAMSTPAPDAATAAPPAPTSSRIVGIDVARGIALLGMAATHILTVTDRRRLPHAGRLALRRPSLGAVRGARGRQPRDRHRRHDAGRRSRPRARARHHRVRARPHRPDRPDPRRDRDAPVAVILAYYAVLFVLALPFLGLRARTLAAARGRLGAGQPAGQLPAPRDAARPAARPGRPRGCS